MVQKFLGAWLGPVVCSSTVVLVYINFEKEEQHINFQGNYFMLFFLFNEAQTEDFRRRFFA
jgi:hypothetical protein